MFPYVYKVKWDCDGTVNTYHGITFAENYLEACRNVSQCYGNEDILKMSITAVGEGLENILELPKDIAHSILAL